MANEEHVALLRQGVDPWNAWRLTNTNVRHPDLSRADLSRADLKRANLSGADLSKALLAKSELGEASFIGANLIQANLRKANLTNVNFSEASLRKADLSKADLSRANLRKANLTSANLLWADLTEADISDASLVGANLGGTNLAKASLRMTDLRFVNLVDADLSGVDLTGCRIYGVSAWGLKLTEAKQENLLITPEHEPKITVDNVEVAQFVYLLLHNPKIRDVIDTVGKKAVLILGRFTEERKNVLDALRNELRQRDYVPILFDFDKPASQDLTATVSTLAHMARFIIADLTDPSSIPYELATVVPTTPVPVQPILMKGQKEFAMFENLQRRFRWVLTPHSYQDLDELISNLSERVIGPAEARVLELQ